MLRKIRAATRLLATSGPTALWEESRKRIGRVVRGSGIGDQFARFAYYSHADGEQIPLYTGYRDYLKPLHLLAHATPAGFDRYVQDNQSSHIEAAGLGGAANFAASLRELGIDFVGKRVLDVGCGDGALAFLLAAYGAENVDGIELTEPSEGWHPVYANILVKKVAELPDRLLVRRIGLRERVSLFVMDVQHPTVEEHYDLIVSNSVLEHITDLRTGLAAMTALLKPGGVMVHVFNPFFSESGGHEWCILDFPWGHVRLTRKEFIDYLMAYRGWEQDAAIKSFDTSFNSPKLTLNEIDAIAEGLGLRCDTATQRRNYWWNVDTSKERLLSQCLRTYPRITWSDLTSDSVTRVWMRI